MSQDYGLFITLFLSTICLSAGMILLMPQIVDAHNQTNLLGCSEERFTGGLIFTGFGGFFSFVLVFEAVIRPFLLIEFFIVGAIVLRRWLTLEETLRQKAQVGITDNPNTQLSLADLPISNEKSKQFASKLGLDQN